MHKQRLMPFLYIIFCVSHVSAFVTLRDLEHYAKSVPENVANDNPSWRSPRYDNFYHARMPSIFYRIAENLGIVRPAWTIEQFAHLLQEITTQAQERKLVGRMVAHHHCQDNDRFIIWGRLHGAFHSLTRDLRQLVSQGILGEDLKITKAHHYFVFNGDVIDHSPYSIETLYAVLLLMHNNPDTVFYLRGSHEDNNYWHNFNLKYALIFYSQRIQGAYTVNEEIPFGDLVERCFETLPLALYLSTNDQSDNVLRISPTGRDVVEIDEEWCGNLFLNTPINSTVYHDIHNKQKTAGRIPDVRAIIKSESLQNNLNAIDGLSPLEQDLGSTAWSVFSSPTYLHQEFLNFFYDAFVILDVSQQLEKSTISICNQSVKNRGGFHIARTLNVISGASKDSPAFNTINLRHTLFIGSTLPLEQGLPLMGNYIRTGILDRLDEENAHGGIDGYLLRALIYNDDYTPFATRRNIEKLLKKSGISLILLPVGTATFEAYTNYIKSGKILVLFPVSSSNVCRKPELKNIVNLRAGHDAEVPALLNYMIDEYTIRKVAFFYQDDSFGKDALTIARNVLHERGIQNAVEVPYSLGLYDFSKQAKAIIDAQPDAIGFFSTSDAAQGVMLAMGIDQLPGTVFFGVSFTGSESFRRFLKNYDIDFTFGAVVPNPAVSMLPIVKEYRSLMNKNYRDYYDVFSLEAYIATSLLIDTLKKIQPPFTHEKILRELQSIKDLDFKGILLNFDPRTNSLAKMVWVEQAPDVEWIAHPIKNNG